MNLKALYDALQKARANTRNIASQIIALYDQGEVEDGLALKDSLEKAKLEEQQQETMYNTLLASVTDVNDPARQFVPANGAQESDEVHDMRASKEYTKQWMNAMRKGVTPKNVGERGAEDFGLLVNALTETGGSPAGEEGGFLNPVDFDNMIHELSREFVDLSNSFNVETVTTLTGWRVIEQFAAALGLTKTDTELEVKADEDEGESPKFTKIEFSLDEYSDFLRVGNNLMSDTPVNLMAYLARWFSKKLVLTKNGLILGLINAITPTNVTDPANAFSAIKTALNKTLDPAFSVSASLFTNQTGLDILDQLEDGTGRPLLQPDPANVTTWRVKGRPVVYLSDAHWANVSGPTRSRIAIGDGREYATLFMRAAFEFASTNIGGSAWRSNSTEVRGIARLDCQEMDTGAMTVLRVNEVKA